MPDSKIPAIPAAEPFTGPELQVIRTAIDMMVRSEGHGLTQTGVNGLLEGRADTLAQRFALTLNVLSKTEHMLRDLMPKTEG